MAEGRPPVIEKITGSSSRHLGESSGFRNRPFGRIESDCEPLSDLAASGQCVRTCGRFRFQAEFKLSDFRRGLVRQGKRRQTPRFGKCGCVEPHSLGKTGEAIRVSQAGYRALAIEGETFEAWRATVQSLARPLQAVAEALAELDAHAALAEWAEEVGAVRPTIDDTGCFEVTAGRHPVVEAAVKAQGDPYTPNDCKLDGSGAACARLSVVTGPNMAGKSTFLRQNALLVVLAQAGAFVPARAMRLGVVDRLFSRVGAGDDLARGRSTFMTEMVETAAILTQATDRSFVVLDEIGRGTATYDGLAIAWAVAEALHDRNRARTLFATHYHELAGLETRLSHVCNLSMAAREWNGDLVFLHEARPGAADRSYGVQVAKLAGVPAAVVSRAREVLDRLEGEKSAAISLDDLPLFAMAEPVAPPPSSALKDALSAVEPDELSPREALEALYRLKAIKD